MKFNILIPVKESSKRVLRMKQFIGEGNYGELTVQISMAIPNTCFIVKIANKSFDIKLEDIIYQICQKIDTPDEMRDVK